MARSLARAAAPPPRAHLIARLGRGNSRSRRITARERAQIPLLTTPSLTTQSVATAPRRARRQPPSLCRLDRGVAPCSFDGASSQACAVGKSEWTAPAECRQTSCYCTACTSCECPSIRNFAVAPARRDYTWRPAPYLFLTLKATKATASSGALAAGRRIKEADGLRAHLWRLEHLVDIGTADVAESARFFRPRAPFLSSVS